MKNINITDEQNKVREKLDKIKQSDLFSQLNIALNQYITTWIDPLQEKNISVYGRLKKESSAIKKIADKNITADEIYDLLAFMIVVDLPEDYDEIQEFVSDTLYGVTYERLFVGSDPTCNGYSSLHLGVDADVLLAANDMQNNSGVSNLSAEVQLKTYGMYMAQESTHDVIYKNNSLSLGEKFYMQTMMFPIIEHLTDIEMYERKLAVTIDDDERAEIEDKILDLKETIKEHIEDYSSYIVDSLPLIDTVFKEFIARKCIERKKSYVASELSNEKTEELISVYRSAINYLNTFQDPEVYGPTVPTGFKNIDELLIQFEDKDFYEVMDLSKKYDEQMLENMINLSKKSVTLGDVTYALEELEGHISSKTEKDDSEQNR